MLFSWPHTSCYILSNLHFILPLLAHAVKGAQASPKISETKSGKSNIVRCFHAVKTACWVALVTATIPYSGTLSKLFREIIHVCQHAATFVTCTFQSNLVVSTCADPSVAICNLFAPFNSLHCAAKLHDWSSKLVPTFLLPLSWLATGSLFWQLDCRIALILRCFSDPVQHLLLSFPWTPVLFTRSLDTSF